MHAVENRERPRADFSLLGGPLYRLGCRLGLVRDGTNTTSLGIALGVGPWVVLLALALVEGAAPLIFSVGAISAHVRLLVAIPLFFVCESVIDRQCAAFVGEIVQSEVVPASARPAMASLMAHIERLRDSWLPEACILAAVVLLGAAAPHQNLFAYVPGHTAGSGSGVVAADTWTSRWYWIVCITLFRFLLLRWVWHHALWCWFLWRVSRLGLSLLPTHPDRAGGLGYLELVHAQYAPLVFAISAIQSASLAQEIASGRIAYEAIYPGVALVLITVAVLFVGPLFVFSARLWTCRADGMRHYGVLGHRYVHAFESKWLRSHGAAKDELLGTADIQSLADLSTSVDVAHDMRLAPISLTMLSHLAIAALVPLLPLALFKYPLADLLQKFVERLAGL